MCVCVCGGGGGGGGGGIKNEFALHVKPFEVTNNIRNTCNGPLTQYVTWWGGM